MIRKIRPAAEADLDGILAVEQATKREIGRDYLEGELSNPLARFFLVEENPGGRIVAYLIAWQLDERDLELHHLAALPQCQRTGLGRGLMGHLCGRLPDGNGRIFLEVREGNRQAIDFYEAVGFVCIGRRKAYYRDPPEDALLYQYNISVDR